MRRSTVFAIFGSAVTVGLVLAAVATGHGGPGLGAGKKAHQNAAVTVFDLKLEPKQEVPRITGLRAVARGNVTLDVTRDSSGAITSGEVVFYVNYDFPGPVLITGLHVHQGAKGVNGPIVVNSGVASFADADGEGNVTMVVTSVAPATLQAILSSPRDYYANLHTSVYPAGAMRDQLSHSNRQNQKKKDD